MNEKIIKAPITYEDWKVELSKLEIEHPNVYKDLKNLLLMQRK